MKFFIDTANLDEIKEANELGLIDGVTTNPSLVAKEGDVDFKEHLAKICEMVKGDISAEVTALDTKGMLEQGREYAKVASNVVVKCPMTLDGLKATRILTAEGTGVGDVFREGDGVAEGDGEANSQFKRLVVGEETLSRLVPGPPKA